MSIRRWGLLALAGAIALQPFGGSAWAQAASHPAAPGQAGMRVHIDPKTGALVDAPAGADALDAARAASAATSTSSAGLVEKSGPTAAHGVSVDLQGRFRSAMRLDLGPNAEAVTHCDTAGPILPAR